MARGNLMMEIYILRHGIAEDTSASGRDEDRQLTPEGIERMRRSAQALKELRVSFDSIFASPYLRAQQTAAILLEELDLGRKLKTSPALVPHAFLPSILGELAEAKPASVMLVGHEPHLSGLISWLLSGTPSSSITMKKGGLCKLRIDERLEPGSATLEWLLAPKHLVRIS